MKKSLIIVGAGSGLSKSIAKKFGQEEFKVGLISRSDNNLKKLSEELTKEGIEVVFETADATKANDLETAINSLKNKLGSVDVLVYNAAALKNKNILDEDEDSLVEDFKVNIANAVTSVKTLLPELKTTKGSVLLTGGGFSLFPNFSFGSISIGKAGIRSLAVQMNEALASDEIFVGTVTVKGFISEEDSIHNPTLIADKFWKLYQDRSEVEIQY